MGNRATPPLKATTPGLARHSLYVGLQARVANSLGISRSVVCRVMQGRKTSRRVSEALAKEIERIERTISRIQGRAA